MIEEMREAGTSEEDIETYLKDLDMTAFEKANEEMRAAGRSEAAIFYFWKEVDSFGDTDPEDMIDSDDEVQ
jgi:hypothetical protein